MKSVQEHVTAVLRAVGPVTPLEVVLADAVGCIVATDIVAPNSLPRADVASRDGYAVLIEDIRGASGHNPVTLPVIADAPIGLSDPMRLVPGGAIRIMSGAPLPTGADAVVAVEATDRGMANVVIREEVAPSANTRARASDIRAGDVLLAKGERVGARQLALIAAVGMGRIAVHPRPRVVVVSIGDELVEPGRAPAPGQTFDANGVSLTSAVQDAGANAFRVGVVPDERVRLREALEDQLVRADLIITTGGLSAGERDTVKEVLAPLGTVRFDNVAMTPGRQHGLGTLGGEIGDDVPIFALPGHPVDAFIAYEVFVRPALRKMAGHSELFRDSVSATVTAGWVSPPGVREFVRATLSGDPHLGYTVTPISLSDEQSISGLAKCNALAVVGEQIDHVSPGDRVHAMILEG